MVYVLMFHELDGSIKMHGFHLGTDLNEAKKITEEKFEWRMANSQPLKFVELTFDHTPVCRYDGAWHSNNAERQSPGFARMKKNLGPDAAERLRLDTIRLQGEALLNAIKAGRVKAGPKILTDIITRKLK